MSGQRGCSESSNVLLGSLSPAASQGKSQHVQTCLAFSRDSLSTLEGAEPLRVGWLKSAGVSHFPKHSAPAFACRRTFCSRHWRFTEMLLHLCFPAVIPPFLWICLPSPWPVGCWPVISYLAPDSPSPDMFKAESWHCCHSCQVLISYKTFATATKEL